MFEELPYRSKVEVCKLFYCDKFKYRCFTHKVDINSPLNVFFSWGWVEFENIFGESRFKRKEISEWYELNLKKIRKHKLLSITKREMVI